VKKETKVEQNSEKRLLFGLAEKGWPDKSMSAGSSIKREPSRTYRWTTNGSVCNAKANENAQREVFDKKKKEGYKLEGSSLTSDQS